MDIRKIIEAWIIAYNPNEDQKKLAALRGDICEGCPSKKTEFFTYCDECGCVIDKKIFTNEYDPCPLHKWSEVDKPYFSDRKTKKTLL